MKKFFLFAITIICALKSYAVTINVSSSYMDNTSTFNQATLHGAHERLKLYFGFTGSGSWTVTESVDVKVYSDVVATTSGDKLIWRIGGTSSYPVRISSGIDGYPEIERPSIDLDKMNFIVEILQSNYVQISGLCFPEAYNGIFINSSDNCRIEGCKFLGSYVYTEHEKGSGPIVVT